MSAVPTAEAAASDALYSPEVMDKKEWKEDMKLWPPVQEHHVIYYLLKTKACDLEEVNAIKSTEAYNYVESGKVGCLFVHEDAATHCVFIKGEVERSQALSAPPHRAWVYLQPSGSVITADCSCMAGAARACSHIGALLWKIAFAVSLGLTGTTCTDKSAEWNRGTRKNVVPGEIEEMDFTLRKQIEPRKPAKGQHGLEFEKFNDHSSLVKSFDTPLLRGLASVQGTILHVTLNAPPADPTNDALEPRGVQSHGLHNDFGPDNCQYCTEFYKKYVDIPVDAQVRLSKGTVLQRGSVWEGSRKVRMTASVTSKIPKRKETLPDKALARLLKPSFRGNKATQHGTQSEPLARKAFEQETGLNVVRAGTVVSRSDPYLSASPDGLVGTDSVIEIKCPYTDDCTNLLESGKYDVRRGDDGYFLSKSGRGGYYSQVQFTMYCCQRKHCFSYVWTRRRTALVNVSYDAEYIRSSLERVRSFYFSLYLPALVDESTTQRSTALEAYAMFLSTAA